MFPILTNQSEKCTSALEYTTKATLPDYRHGFLATSNENGRLRTRPKRLKKVLSQFEQGIQRSAGALIFIETEHLTYFEDSARIG